jgi:hypothetical protein
MLDVKEVSTWEAFEGEVEDLFERAKKRRSEQTRPSRSRFFEGSPTHVGGFKPHSRDTVTRNIPYDSILKSYEAYGLKHSRLPERLGISSPTVCNSLTDIDLSKSTSS